MVTDSESSVVFSYPSADILLTTGVGTAVGAIVELTVVAFGEIGVSYFANSSNGASTLIGAFGYIVSLYYVG